MGLVYLSTIMMLVSVGNGPFYCKWGKAVDVPAGPSCGKPHVIRTPLPPSGKRLEFRKSENPGLSGYFIRRKDGTGPVKQFRNLVNIYAVDLLLCPKDFESPRTLLFHLKTPRGWQPVQCKLGPLEKKTPGKVQPTSVQGHNRKSAPVHRAKTTETTRNSDAPDASSTYSPKNGQQGGPVTSVLDLPSCVVQKNDVFARALGWGAVGISLLALVMAAFALASARSHRNDSGEE